MPYRKIAKPSRGWLHQKYSLEQLSLLEIANICGVSKSTARYWLKKHKVVRRSHSEAAIIKLLHHPDLHPTRGKRGPWLGKRRSEAPAWRGGRTINDGYVYIYSPDHPAATKTGYVLESRLVMEKHIGRPLHRGEIVHYINGDTEDNRIDNLILFPSRKKHVLFHLAVKKAKGGKHADQESK